MGVASPLRMVTVAGFASCMAPPSPRFCASVLPSMSVNVICSSLNPETSIALIVSSMPSSIPSEAATAPDVGVDTVGSDSADDIPALAVGLEVRTPLCRLSVSVDLDKAANGPGRGDGKQDLVTATIAIIAVHHRSHLAWSRISSLALLVPLISTPTVMVCMFPLASWMLRGANVSLGIGSSSAIVSVRFCGVAV